MAGDHLQHVRTGQRFAMPARAYNDFADAARAHKQGLLGTNSPPLVETRSLTALRIKNETMDVIPRFGVAGIDDPIILPADSEDGFKNQLAFRASAPAVGTHDEKFVIALEPIGAGRIGLACFAGVCAARVDFGTPGADAGAAAIIDATTSHLIAADSGIAQVLWREGGDGEQWAAVRLGAAMQTAEFLAEITGSTLVVADQSWRYQWKKKLVHASNPGVFIDAAPAVTHAELGEAYNLAETAAPTWKNTPIPNGRVVLMRVVKNGANSFPVFQGTEIAPEDCGA